MTKKVGAESGQWWHPSGRTTGCGGKSGSDFHISTFCVWRSDWDDGIGNLSATRVSVLVFVLFSPLRLLVSECVLNNNGP
jgi:hypothetical protein